MAKRFAQIESPHRDFIGRHHVFFTGSAAPGGRVNISPKGLEAFRVIDPNRVAYLDHTGSSSETSAHLKVSSRLTIMFCAFSGPPLILRLYGHGRSVFLGTPEFQILLDAHFGGRAPAGARQIVVQEVDLVQTSCGFGVPLFDYVEERESLTRWAASKGSQGLEAYRLEKNSWSLDGLATGFGESAG